MKIETSRPFSRGVHDLMFVGDVPVASPPPCLSPAMAALVVVGALTSGWVRWGAWGIAAYSALTP